MRLSFFNNDHYTYPAMTNVQKQSLGSFCWIELGTSDQAAAKKFYSSLFSWTPNDSPIGPDDFYTIFKLDGRDAAAAYTLRKEEREQHVPPHWNLYIAVQSADDAVAKAAKLGGKVLAPAFDVMDAGRMAVIQDPTGAAFCVWQANKYSGLSVTGENNAFCWADLVTPDPAGAEKFYSSLFGWKVEKDEEEDHSGYLHINLGDHHIGGIPPAQRDAKIPPHWMIYFMVANVEAGSKKAKQMGASIYMPAQKMEGVGTWAVLADPQGAVFALFKSAR